MGTLQQALVRDGQNTSKKLENLFVAMNIDSNKRKKALLLHFAGDEVFEIHQTLPFGKFL